MESKSTFIGSRVDDISRQPFHLFLPNFHFSSSISATSLISLSALCHLPSSSPRPLSFPALSPYHYISCVLKPSVPASLFPPLAAICPPPSSQSRLADSHLQIPHYMSLTLMLPFCPRTSPRPPSLRPLPYVRSYLKPCLESNLVAGL